MSYLEKQARTLKPHLDKDFVMNEIQDSEKSCKKHIKEHGTITEWAVWHEVNYRTESYELSWERYLYGYIKEVTKDYIKEARFSPFRELSADVSLQVIEEAHNAMREQFA